MGERPEIASVRNFASVAAATLRRNSVPTIVCVRVLGFTGIAAAGDRLCGRLRWSAGGARPFPGFQFRLITIFASVDADRRREIDCWVVIPAPAFPPAWPVEKRNPSRPLGSSIAAPHIGCGRSAMPVSARTTARFQWRPSSSVMGRMFRAIIFANTSNV
jgi:hypothetical protein